MNVLLIDYDRVHAKGLELTLNRRGFARSHPASIREAIRLLKSRAASIELVVLVIGDHLHPWIEILHQLQKASWQAGIGDFPFFLCIARLNCGLDFQLRVERMGARFVLE